MTMLVKIGLGALAAVVLAVAAMFVLQLGPFNHRPSVAAKALPKVQATVAKANNQAVVATAAAETKTKAAATDTEKRTEEHVAKIRAAAPRVIPAAVPDGQFYDSVCDTQFYAGSADCSGLGRQPEGGGAGHGARALRRR